MATNETESEVSPPQSLGLVERASKFLLEDLWSGGVSGASAFRGGLIGLLRVCVITVESFNKDLCLLRASALTYATLMAFVPVLAISFAFLRGFGWSGDRLEELILGKVTLLSPEAVSVVVSYVDNTNIAGLGVVGAAVLLITAVSVMSNIEHSINAIWGSPPRQNWLRKTSDYLAVIIAAPLMLALGTSMTAALNSDSTIGWLRSLSGVGALLESVLAFSAYAVVWVLFALLYAFVPNTKVRLLPAAIGGIIAGTTWQLTQMAYINFQFGVAKYNAIYGAMAQLPILMAWVYVSWVIVLLGAEIGVAVQHLSVYSQERRASGAGYALREYLGLRVVGRMAEAAHARAAAPTVEELSRGLDVPQRTVREIVEALREGGLMHFGGSDQTLCFLSLAPSSVPVRRVLDVLRGGSAVDGTEAADGSGGKVEALVKELEGARSSALGEATVADLVT